MTKVAFLGLGVMGYPMAGHLVAAGHDVSVWNRTASVTERWGSEYDGSTNGAVADAVSGADVVMMCVGQDADVLDVASRAVPAMKTGAILVDHTTASDGCAKQVGKLCAEAGLGFIDAPISGGEAGAVKGQLTVMCGGDQTHFDGAKPVIDAYAKAVKLMGPVGAGQLTKMVNQICIAGMLQGLSEAVNFAQAAGLDMDEVVGAIGKGAAQSWQMDNRATTMAKGEYEFGFAVDWMRKDLGIVLDTAKALDLDMPVTELVDSYYAEVQAMGGNRWDTSSLLARLKSKT
ncbi:3-hydroxyisobutyrate dehydrogenase [Litorimonas cladophorae]|uniref:3-hydroxyisobutyrate dehydrogenase n=1 Tax=Litorimonas cladophorae TaxID=1220491 RepID=A0A918KDH9_9PROT|nr:NAD(P)-dependent oxidoreductase [Litorimonas cladophorae]GGX59661.1 3-hydroxyisobutyrate dehydrogenase [Litorimonas cladophorae]